MNKPTFGAPTQDKPAENTDKFREEAGAIWERESKKNNSKYMNIVLKLPKSKLLELIKNADEEGNVKVEFVAFRNKSQNGISKRPAFRIYEEARPGNLSKERSFRAAFSPTLDKN